MWIFGVMTQQKPTLALQGWIMLPEFPKVLLTYNHVVHGLYAPSMHFALLFKTFNTPCLFCFQLLLNAGIYLDKVIMKEP